MYWIFIPSFIIWLAYFGTTLYSKPLFEYLHFFDYISIFGWELDLREYIVSVEWFYFFLLFELFKFVVLTLLSPFNAYISELYDQKFTGEDFQFSFVRMLEDLFRGLLISVTAFSLELIFTGFWLLLNLFFPLEFLTPVAYMLIGSFFFGFAFFDVSLERHEYGVLAAWKYAFKKMSSCFWIGALFSLIMYIPHLGIVIAPPLITLLATQRFLILKRNLKKSYSTK